MKETFPQEDEEFSRILQLRRDLEVIFFRQFEDNYELPRGMNFTHMRTLLIIRFHGKTNMTEISRLMLIEKGSFTPVAARLTSLGLTEKVGSKEDRRVTHLLLTDLGRELVDGFASTHREYIHNKIDKVDREKQKEFFSLVDRMVDLCGLMDEHQNDAFMGSGTAC